jgi:hypothetical protein
VQRSKAGRNTIFVLHKQAMCRQDSIGE